MATRTANIPVVSSGDGPQVAISDLVGQKTVVLSGFFQGSYTLLATHDGADFAPVLLFNTDGQEKIVLTLSEAYSAVKLRTNANPTGMVTASISGVSVPGQNSFGSFPPIPAGATGPQASIDTFALVPPTGFEADINFIVSATLLTGSLVIEGSTDNVNFNPVGTFTGGSVQRSLVGLPASLEFNPLPSQDIVRYYRVNVQGQLASQAIVTMGGGVPASGGNTGLQIPISIGPTAGDLTHNRVALGLLVTPLSGAVGQDSVVAGNGASTTALSTGAQAVGYGTTVKSDHGAAFGSTITIDVNCSAAVVVGYGSSAGNGTSSASGSVVVGPYSSVNAINSSVIGISCNVNVDCDNSICIGVNSNVNNPGTSIVAIGTSVTAGQGTEDASNSIAIGTNALVSPASSQAIGDNSSVGTGSLGSVALGSNATVKSAAGGSIAIGSHSTIKANASEGIAIGASSNVTAADGISIGGASSTINVGAIALGNTAKSYGIESIVIGQGAADNTGATATYAIAIGSTAVSLSNHGIAIGRTANVGTAAAGGIAIGSNETGGHGSTQVLAPGGIAIGQGTVIPLPATNSMAFGAGASAGQADEVVFGGDPYITLFHVPSSLGFDNDLFSFNTADVVNNHDTCMRLYYKNAVGTIVSAKVTVNVTGQLTVPV